MQPHSHMLRDDAICHCPFKNMEDKMCKERGKHKLSTQLPEERHYGILHIREGKQLHQMKFMYRKARKNIAHSEKVNCTFNDKYTQSVSECVSLYNITVNRFHCACNFAIYINLYAIWMANKGHSTLFFSIFIPFTCCSPNIANISTTQCNAM